ncbi:Na(+)/H(+) antiporter NhaD [Gammaproteobacteria bacterium]
MTEITEHLPELTNHWAGITALGIFILAYVLVITEETTQLRKSKPMVVAAGLLWILIAFSYRGLGPSHVVEGAFRQVFLEYAELMLFLLVAMTYVNTLEDRNVFAVLKAWLVRSGFSYRALFWITGTLAFFISSVADNLTTALVVCAVVLAVGRNSPGFVVLSCINIVVAVNAGGTFSPFGDITTLMVWQKGVLSFSEFFVLFVPAMVSFVVPAAFMHWAVPAGAPSAQDMNITLKPGAVVSTVLFILTIITAIVAHNLFTLPPVLGMMTGLGYLQLQAYFLRRSRGELAFDFFHKIVAVEWDTLLFFYGVMMCVGALGVLGYLAVMSQLMYGQLGPSAANILIGIISAILDNIPLMFAVLTIHPDMSDGQWLLITLTTGIGGSLLSIGSAAGVALMGQSRGIYTFMAHLRWTPAVAAGYAAGVFVHMILNKSLF